MDTEKKNSGSKETNWKKELLEWILMLACTVAVVVVFNSFIVVNMKIPSGSMEDGIQVGDRIFANRLSYVNSEPERMDIVVFRYPDDRSQLFIKRIIGLPGETLEVREGRVYVDGTPLDDPYNPDGTMARDMEPVTVPPGTVFVMGDNRNHSMDSRDETVGPIPLEKVRGKGLVLIWPLNKLKILE